jgi:hypothetical protein
MNMRSWLTRIAVVAALGIFPLSAHAQSRIDQLSAGAAVSATDTLPNCQGCGASTAAVGTTFTQILTFLKAQTYVWTGTHTFTNSLLKLLGSSTGATTFTSANSGSSNFTVTIPAVTDTLAVLGTAQTFSASQTFGESHGTTYAPTLTSNDYTATTTDCGKTLLMPTGTTPTLTLPNLNAACTIVAVQNSATQFTVQAASGGSVVSVNSYTKSKAQNAILFLTIITPSASAAKWALAGDGA